jgi:hypothetical protein
MMRWLRIELLIVTVSLLGAACEKAETAKTGFSRAPEAEAVPVMLLKNDSSRTPAGNRVAELHVLLPVGTTEEVARTTLQHVIDSVAAADTLAAAVKVTGFVISTVDRVAGSADIVPAMAATWGPIDSAGFTGANRKSRFRTHFVLVRPLDGSPPTVKQP